MSRKQARAREKAKEEKPRSQKVPEE